MKAILAVCCTLLSLFLATNPAAAQGTTFTYQGRLSANATAGQGLYDLRFSLFSLGAGGAQVGAILTNSLVGITNGLFTARLDFGVSPFDGSDRWLEIGVRTNGAGAFTTLTPRQQLTATPYAVRAGSISGPILESQLPAAALRLNSSGELVGPVKATDPGNIFAGDGSGLNNVAAAAVGPAQELQYQSTFFRKLGTIPSGDGLMQSYGVSGTAVGDFNRDGLPDLLVSMAGIGVSQLYYNTGGGELSWAGNVNFYLAIPRQAVVADFNGDGWPDITGDQRNNSLTVLSNTPAGGFATMAVLPISNITAQAAADVNGDGRKDLIVAVSGAPARLQVYLSSGTGFALSASFNLPGTARDLAVGDLNGDTRMDIVAACPDAGRIAIFTNSGAAITSGPELVAPEPWAVAIGNFNSGAQADIAYMRRSGSFIDWQIAFLYQNGNLSFQPGDAWPFVRLGYTTSIYGARLTAADFDGDGRSDLLAGIGFFGIESMALLINSGGDAMPREVARWNGPGISDFGVADFNGDNRMDLGTGTMIANARGGAVWLSDSRGINVAATAQFMGSVSVNGPLTADAGLRVSRGLTADAVTVTDGIELGNSLAAGRTPFIDFHYGTGSAQDYNVRLINDANGQLTLAGNTRITGNASFGSQTRQMLNLWGTGYGIGVQSATLYQRTDGGFAWHRQGAHTDNANDPGAGGTRLMALSSAGDLALRQNINFELGPLRQMLNLWNGEHAIGVQAWATYFRTIGGAADGAFVWYKGGVHNDAQYNPGGGTELMRLNSGGLTVRGTFVSSSDRNLKENFGAVDSSEILEKVAALPIQSWNYTNDTTRHIGPVAQDFHEAFAVGPDDKHITVIDADGVALAAIKGLNTKLLQELKRRDAETAALKARLEALEERLRRMTP